MRSRPSRSGSARATPASPRRSTTSTEYPYDLDAAKQLVEEAGVVGEEIVLATAPISSDFNVIAQATAAAAESIGLKATIETVTPNAYTALFSDPSAREGVDLFYTSWYLSSPDPLEMYSVLRTGEFSNYGGWSDPEFDQVVNEAIAIDDPAARSREDRGGAAHRQRAAARGCRCTPVRCRCSSGSASPASRRRSRSCTTRGRPPLAPGSGIRRPLGRPGGAAVAS